MLRKFNYYELESNYNFRIKNSNREIGKWLFSIATLGLGALYLWSTTQVVRRGEIGLRQTLNGDWILLPPGRHSNFPWESYYDKPKSLSQKLITMGPYKIFTVETGFVAETSNAGQLEIVKEPGQYIIHDASHTFDGLVSVKQETKKLHTVEASTSDNVAVTIQADVRYQIDDPEKALRQIDDIEDSIKEIAEISISQIVSHHSLNDFAPAMQPTVGASTVNATTGGITKVIFELIQKVTDQLSKIGIKLLNIGITSWSINDKSLAHELAQAAVIKSQTQSKLMAAENAAKIAGIEALAAGNAIMVRAEAEARANEMIGSSYIAIAEKLQDSPVAQEIYARHQQKEIIADAKNASIFYAMPLTSQGNSGVNFTLPSKS